MRAKFYVESVLHTAPVGKPDAVSGQVVLRAATAGEENKGWSKYTPAGSIQMTIDNELALAQFKPGEHVGVLFTPTPETYPF